MSIISNCTASAIKDAAISLIDGNLVAFPTETVYGLGADATNEKAVARIYEIKGRPVDHPLIVHISSAELLDKWARDIPEYAIKLARAFWPGPMTLILPRTNLAKDFITGGQETVGLRVPAHTVALSLMKQFEIQGGYGVAAPSANRFGKLSPTSTKAVKEELGDSLKTSDLILEGGFSKIGLESTIINCVLSAPTILRPGGITKEMIEKELQINLETISSGSNFIRAPGQLESHYSPDAYVTKNSKPKIGDGFIAMSNFPTPSGVIRLASPKDNVEYAQILYSALRAGDRASLKKVSIIPPDLEGIGVGINDRINKIVSKNNEGI
jgi:L-threonylcarbamoyladenylate synthase